MIKWILPTAFALGIFCVFLYKKAISWRHPAHSSIALTLDEEQLKGSIQCALDAINPYHKDKSLLTLNFVYRRLAQKFGEYGISNPIEKAHFLAQVFQETNNLLYTVEKYGTQRWNPTGKPVVPFARFACIPRLRRGFYNFNSS